MTTSKAVERAGGPEREPRAVFGYMAAILRQRLWELGLDGARNRFPLTRYQRDPGGFARDILGVVLMIEQLEIAQAIVDNRRVAVRGGRKVGKDFCLAVMAIWFYCCFEGARVRFTAVKFEQVDDIFWRQVRALLRDHGRCVACKRAGLMVRPCPHSLLIPEAEDVAMMARTGLKCPHDDREIVGYTTREAEGAAGISGGNQLYIIDEASGVEDRIVEPIVGNLLGSDMGRLVLISNPTRTVGQFWRAFHEESAQWKTFHLSSRVIASKYGGRIPGIARLDEIEAEVKARGPESVFARVHIDGEFPEAEEGTIFELYAVKASIERWKTTPADGQLYVGVDVAGESGVGDETAIAIRRGRKCLAIETRRGMSPEEHLAYVLGVLTAHPSDDPNQRPVVIIDKGGEPGSKVWGVFVAYRTSQWENPPFRLVGVDSSRKAQRDPKAYDRVRDELVANLADWVRSGGAIPDDPKLAEELTRYRWVEQRIQAANKLLDKKAMRQLLGRSPDRADALALACWVERHWRPPTATEPAAPIEEPADLQDANAIWYGDQNGGTPSGGDNDPWWPKG
jgi:phage terminase large subunit